MKLKKEIKPFSYNSETNKDYLNPTQISNLITNS